MILALTRVPAAAYSEQRFVVTSLSSPGDEMAAPELRLNSSSVVTCAFFVSS
jgi:hypothetical protein